LAATFSKWDFEQFLLLIFFKRVARSGGSCERLMMGEQGI